jgi:hypothetical protein
MIVSQDPEIIYEVITPIYFGNLRQDDRDVQGLLKLLSNDKHVNLIESTIKSSAAC